MHKRFAINRIWKLWGSLSLVSISLIVALSAAGSIYGLRNNNLKMIELKEKVFELDKQGSNQEIEQAVKELASYVTSHMNTSVSKDSRLVIEGEQPIQLVHKYYRDSIRQMAKAAEGSQQNLSLLGQARIACEVQTVPITERLDCVKQQLANLSNDTFPAVAPLPKDTYVFNFYTPAWSPDLAGFSLVVFGLSIILLAIRFVIGAVVSARLRRK